MTREEIEKKAYEVYPEIREEHTERDINAPYRKAYIKGLTEQLDCQKIKGWVAREPKFNLMLFTAKPERFGDMWDVMAGEEMPINPSLFPDLCWEDEPIEVELIVNRI